MPAPVRRRISLDVRLLFGLVLVAASVLGVVGIVAAADARVTVYAAPESLSPGDRVDADDLVERSVALDGAEELYVTVGSLPPDGLVLMQSVRAGELLAVSAVGSTAGTRATAVVLTSSTPVSGSVEPGSTVDVWAAPAVAEGAPSSGFGPPAVLVSGAVVVRVVDDDGLMSGGGSSAVEVLVPRSRIARVLQAIANGDAIAIVPAGLPWERR